MILALFRSRVRPEAVAEYRALAEKMSALAKTMPGYIAHKGFVAADGEQVTIAEFDTAENLREWSRHPEHVKAKALGRKTFYESYRVQLCTVDRDHAFPPPAPGQAQAGADSPLPAGGERSRATASG